MTKIERVIAYVTDHIRSGEWAPGTQIPSTAQLGEILGVSAQPIRTAVERLRAAGWITTAPGAGMFVAEHPPVGGTDG